MSRSVRGLGNPGVSPVSNGEIVINVADYATPQDALDVAPAGAWVFFPPGTYALTTSLVVKADGTHIDALGAHFVISTWGAPVFDAIGRSGCFYDIGVAEFAGTRGGTGSTWRGSNAYCSGTAVWINGDRNYVRTLRTINLPVGVFLSSYAGTSTYDRYGVDNHIGTVEVEGYDFGVLFVGQRNLVIDDLYGHDDTDDSAGVNPTHLYYCSAAATFRTVGLTIKKARCDNHLHGQPFQLKYVDAASLTNHTARHTTGLINIIDGTDLTWSALQGIDILANAGQGAITFGAISATPKRSVLSDTSVVQAVGVNERVGVDHLRRVPDQRSAGRVQPHDRAQHRPGRRVAAGSPRGAFTGRPSAVVEPSTGAASTCAT